MNPYFEQKFRHQEFNFTKELRSISEHCQDFEIMMHLNC